MCRLVLVSLTFLASAVFWASTAFCQERVELTIEPQLSQSGYYRISWSPTSSGPFVLQESRHVSFKDASIIYQGSDMASVISGKTDGTYHYRLKGHDGIWSTPATVKVRHHNLERALWFLVVGCVVFIATFILIVRGHLLSDKRGTDQ